MEFNELPDGTHVDLQDPSTPHEQAGEPSVQPAVRFASVNQEIEPAHSLQTETIEVSSDAGPNEISPGDQEHLQNISRSLQNAHLQQSRMCNCAFEPVSLPVSRVPTNESTNQALREGTKSGRGTPRGSPSPSGIGGTDLTKTLSDSLRVTPQISPTSKDGFQSAASSNPPSRPSSASDRVSTQPTSHSQSSISGETQPKVPRFSIGPIADSAVPSRGASPSRIPGGKSGTVTPPTAYSRPLTPAGDRDDPYARSKRPPQEKSLGNIDPRFVFDSLDSRRRSPYGSWSNSSTTHVPRSSSGSDLKSQHRQSLAGKKDQHGQPQDEGKHGSMTDLKRFFHIGHHKGKRSDSPSRSAKASISRGGVQTPPHQLPASNVPFADDHGLETKYGKFGRVLGSGAGGSVRLIKRSSDNTTFAVKQFRDRHAYESERAYSKKVTAEFCVGSTLHHGNIIETLDIIHEKGRWYVVMEYAPYDLFAIVMSGKMSKEEIACSFVQIVSGVSFLHSMGLAHRDLKLDNVVVNEHGIMKIIDFGSAIVFRYPFENDVVLASGIVGSDPYLAPEVYASEKYDPQPTDIWSLAVIFSCMIIRRFPWKAPRLTDSSYKLFASTPNITPTEEFASRPKSEVQANDGAEDPRRELAPDTAKTTDREGGTRSHHHRHHHHDTHGQATDPTATAGTLSETPTREPLKGPWRLLRLLPRESRPIINSMLEIDPRRRATVEDILQDPWVTQTPVCSQIEGGEVIKAEGHYHNLEHSTTVTSA